MADESADREGTSHSVISAPHVRMSGETARVGLPEPEGEGPHVHLIREGEVVTAVEVVCRCGERIRLRLTY
jgi:hypothetical protein